MDKDSVRLVIGGYTFTEFQSLEIVSDLYKPSGSFRFELGRRVNAASGQDCQVWVNDRLEMTGIIDPLDENQDKKSHTWSIAGRSLVGLIEDSYITEFETPPTTLKAAANKYLKSIPYIQNKTWTIDGKDSSNAHARVDVGDTVFKLLNAMSQNRGLLFWAEPDGNLRFGKAKGKGEPMFHIGAKVESRHKGEDVSKLHSEIHVISDSDEDGFKRVIVKNPSVKRHCPFVAPYNGADYAGLKKQANDYLRKEKIEALQLDYVLPGFSQNGKNWRINELCQVDDDTFGLRDTFLVTRRSFRLDRTNGSTTSVVLGPILAEDVFKAYPKSRKKDTDS